VPEQDEDYQDRESDQPQRGNLDQVEVPFALLFLSLALIEVGKERVIGRQRVGYHKPPPGRKLIDTVARTIRSIEIDIADAARGGNGIEECPRAEPQLRSHRRAHDSASGESDPALRG
jgi:hypothetical protein